MTQKIVNDFSVRIATANGTGSMSANNIFFKSLFRMGICTSSKNLFPSNIKGLPTWYQVRASHEGYTSMKKHSEVQVLINKGTYKKDHDEAPGDAVIIYDSTVMPEEDFKRDDVIYYPVPMTKLVTTHFEHARLRTLLKNIIYLGVIVELFQVDKEIVDGVIRDMFSKKQKVVDSNLQALQVGMDYVKQNLPKKDPYYYEKENSGRNHKKIVIEGNAATALGCVYGGVTVVAWYPITPSSSLAEGVIEFCEKYRKDKEGKNKFAIVQAEDELCAVGVCMGAGWAGARSMTTTSGPGISLMGEFAGLGYYAEIPVVIIDVQRVGPSTGLPTRTQQSDLTQVAHLSHGDTKHVMLFPGNPKECFELAAQAFDIAEVLQTPIFIMSDLDLGMNQWVSDEFSYPTHPYNRGKVLHKEDLDGVETFRRYFAGDEDKGIPSRTLPGTNHPLASYFTRGSGHDEDARYTEDPDAYRRNMLRLLKKFEGAGDHLPKPLFYGDKNAKTGFVAIGTSHDAIVEARDYLAKEKIQTKYMRLLSYPFHKELETFIKSCDKVIVVEQNRDAQLRDLIKLSVSMSESKLLSLAYSDGLPLSAEVVFQKSKELLNGC